MFKQLTLILHNRNRSVIEDDDHEKSKDEEDDGDEEEDEPLGNRSRRSLRQRVEPPKSRDESSEPLMRRSTRYVFYICKYPKKYLPAFVKDNFVYYIRATPTFCPNSNQD